MMAMRNTFLPLHMGEGLELSKIEKRCCASLRLQRILDSLTHNMNSETFSPPMHLVKLIIFVQPSDIKKLPRTAHCGSVLSRFFFSIMEPVFPRISMKLFAGQKRQPTRDTRAVQNGIGWMYQNGHVVNMDMSAALEWYRRAAAQGHVNSAK